MTPDQKAWEEAGWMCAKRAENSVWEMAWWLVEGQLKDYDKNFTRSSEILGLSNTTLHTYYRVGFAYPRGKVLPLSFTSHRELLRERDVALRGMVASMAIEHNWTSEDIVRHFEKNPPSTLQMSGEDEPAGRDNKAPYSRKYYQGVHVKCPCGCGHVFPVKGNKAPAPDKD